MNLDNSGTSPILDNGIQHKDPAWITFNKVIIRNYQDMSRHVNPFSYAKEIRQTIRTSDIGKEGFALKSN
jgi:hypothetical protein